MSIKFLVLGGGGYFGFGGGGGGEVPILLLFGSEQSARERIGRQNLSQKVPSKKGSLGVIFSQMEL